MGWLTKEVAPGPKIQTDEELSEYGRRVAHTVYHPAGTTKMGAESDKMAVVTPELRIRGLKGVRLGGGEMERRDCRVLSLSRFCLSFRMCSGFCSEIPVGCTVLVYFLATLAVHWISMCWWLDYEGVGKGPGHSCCWFRCVPDHPSVFLRIQYHCLSTS